MKREARDIDHIDGGLRGSKAVEEQDTLGNQRPKDTAARAINPPVNHYFYVYWMVWSVQGWPQPARLELGN